MSGSLHATCLATLILASAGCWRRSGDLHSPAPERRAAAVAALASRNDQRDLSALLVAQRDPSPLVRQAAVGAFTVRGGAGSADALGKLLEDSDPDVAAAAARGLGAIPHLSRPADARDAEALQRRARGYLVEAYANAGPGERAEIASALQALGASLREAVEAESRRLWDRNRRALAAGSNAERSGAAEELGRSGRAEVAKHLLPLLESEPQKHPALAAAAARGLGAAGDHSIRPVLEKLLGLPDAVLAEAGAEALGVLGDPAAAEALARAGLDGPTRLSQVILTALSRLPQAPAVEVALCEIMGRAQDPGVAQRAAALAHAREATCPDRPLLARALRRGPDAAWIVRVIGALGPSGDRATAVAEALLPLAASPPPDPALRVAVAETLGKLERPAAAPVLLRRGQALLQKGAGDEPELAAFAVALAQLRSEDAGRFALLLAAHPHPGVRAGAFEALGIVGGNAARDRLLQALGDPDPDARRVGAEALARFRAPAAAALAGALRQARPGDGIWRQALIRSLGETSSPEAVSPLADLLQGPEAAAAAVALGRTGQAEAVKPLLAILGRPQGAARLEAIEALVQLQAEGAGPALSAQLTSDRPEVRAAAARALGRLREEGTSGLLEALRSDYYGEVRRAAVDALARLPAPGTATR